MNLTHLNQKTIEENDQEIDYLKKNVATSCVGWEEEEQLFR